MKPYIVTHDGIFHGDEVFATAAIHLWLQVQPSIRIDGDDISPEDFDIVRSRDPGVIKDAYIAVDVGLEHAPEKGRFDHHQAGGAGDRAIERAPNVPTVTIPYASFGLVWKEFGAQVVRAVRPRLKADPAVVATMLDAGIVAHVDAGDHGPDYRNPEVRSPGFSLNRLIGGFNTGTTGDRFDEALNLAEKILINEIAAAVEKAETDAAMADVPVETLGTARVGILPAYMRGWSGVDAVIHPDVKPDEGKPQLWVLTVANTHIIPPTDHPGVLFRHNAGFMAKGISLEAMKALAATVTVKESSVAG